MSIESAGGFTPEVEAHLFRAITVVREAVKVVETAWDAAEDGSDARVNCDEALRELEDALYYLRLRPLPESAEQAAQENGVDQ